jgi:hypothetical protein
MSKHEGLPGPVSGPPPLRWVNHNARNRNTLLDRHAIFSHVQSSYKRWKRQEDALSLQKASRVPGSHLMRVREPDTKPQSHIARHRKLKFEEGDGDQSYADDTAKEDPLHDRLEFIVSQTHPQSILTMGNSDPFHAFAIPVDAGVAHVMTYTSDVYLPGIYRHHNLSDQRAANSQAFDEITAFLHDECTAYAHLARIVAVMPGNSAKPGSTSLSVMYKNKVLLTLRKRLMHPDSLRDPKIPAAILLFLTAELYDGNLEASSFHARILAHILETGLVDMNLWFLFKALYHDTQRACLSLARPAFDLETWLPRQFASLCLTNMPLKPDEVIHETRGQLDASIMNSSMKGLISEARYCRDAGLLMSEDQRLAHNQMNWYLGCRMMACVGGTVNHYLDSRDMIRKEEDLDQTSLKAAQTEAYASLALLYLVRCEARMEAFRFGQKDTIFHANRLILTRMKELLELDATTQHPRMKLFALFVGAYAEQAQVVTTCEVPEKGWFNVNLAAQAVKLGLWTWGDVREILLGFHYSDALQPHGSIWFWKTMSANVKLDYVPHRVEGEDRWR